MTSAPPPTEVLAAFGATGDPVPLAGGQGSSWRADDVVLKPLDVLEAQIDWQDELFGTVSCDGFRLARPLHARDGSLVVDGWTGWQALDGRHEEGRWGEIVAVGERLHTALRDAPRPDFLAHRTDKWSIADRVAWGELPPDTATPVKHLPRLLSALRAVDAPSQVVHTDLAGNVLFDDRLPPAVIDFSPSWRPTGYASAMVVGDALVWEGADERILDAVAHVEDFAQYLLRALVFRAVVDGISRAGEPLRPDDDDPFLPAVELACRLAGAT